MNTYKSNHLKDCYLELSDQKNPGLNNLIYTQFGTMPKRFDFADGTAIWVRGLRNMRLSTHSILNALDLADKIGSKLDISLPNRFVKKIDNAKYIIITNHIEGVNLRSLVHFKKNDECNQIVRERIANFSFKLSEKYNYSGFCSRFARLGRKVAILTDTAKTSNYMVPSCSKNENNPSLVLHDIGFITHNRNYKLE